MSLKAFLEARKEADASAAKLLSEMEALQGRIAEQLADEITKLETVGGKIVNSTANITRIGAIVALSEQLIGDELWLTAVGDYIGSMDTVNDGVLAYMRTLGPIDEEPLLALNRQFKTLVANTLTNPQTYAGNVFLPVAQDLAASITQQATITEAIDSVALVVEGSEDSLGPIAGDIGPIAIDVSKVSERSITQQAADQLDVKFYFYQGSEIDTTRKFCEDRRGRYWHKKEVEGWASLQWDGKVEGTNAKTIFIWLGGWYGKEKGCRHALVPVARRDVPPADIARMKAAGLID